MKMQNIIQKIRRRSLRTINRLTPVSASNVGALADQISKPPADKASIDKWTADVSSTVNSLVLERIAKEDLATILTGLIAYRRTGITPAASQHAMVRAYENTSGLFQEILHRSLFEPSEQSGSVNSDLFGTFTDEAVRSIVADISKSGYHVLPQKLSPNIVAKIRDESHSYSYRLKGGAKSGAVVKGIDPTTPPACISAYANAPESVLLKVISEDPLFLRVASDYLGSKATAIDSTFWYTFPHDTPSSETAQLFHYDLDTIRWLKVFVYLSDVGRDQGPHEYVEATHRPENKAPQVLLKEYARIDDQEIDQFYPGRRRQITGAAGTVIFGDTRCFHKGTSVKDGHRLIFSPIYAPSRIGYFHG